VTAFNTCYQAEQPVGGDDRELIFGGKTSDPVGAFFPRRQEKEAIVNTLATARFETGSIHVDDRGRRPDERVFDFSIVERRAAPGQSPRDDRKETEPGDGIVPDLADVSETMLWSLHNRASEARRPDGVLVDPESVRIHSAISYDFARNSAILWAHSRHGRPKSTKRYGRGSNAIRTGSSCPSGRA
jgi:hypothetical protein